MYFTVGIEGPPPAITTNGNNNDHKFIVSTMKAILN